MADDFPASADDLQVATRFKPGVSGNPAGRKPGSRNKLGEAFLDDVRDLWERRGAAILEKCADTEPMQTAKMVAGLLPREVVIAAFHVNASSAMSELAANASTFMEAWKIARSTIGAEPPLIDLQADMEHDLRDVESFADDD